jgi:hypothetical protein
MNYWSIGQIPYSWAPKNVTIKWSGMDHLDNYRNNPQRTKWEQIDITYQYNSQGFRCPDLNKFLRQKVNIALGCSFTEGVGLPVECTWPSLIQQRTEYPMLNLGIGAGSTDSVARILTNISSLFDIQTVYILWPPLHRIECYLVFDKHHKLITNTLYKNGHPVDPEIKMRKIETIYPMDSNIEHAWAMTDEMNIQRLYKNQLLTNLVAQQFGYRIVQTTVDAVSSIKPAQDFARDGVHWGIDSQKLIAQHMLDNQ